MSGSYLLDTNIVIALAALDLQSKADLFTICDHELKIRNRYFGIVNPEKRGYHKSLLNFIMKRTRLLVEEIELLNQELQNSKTGQAKEIRRGLLILFIGILSCILIWILSLYRFMGIALSIAILGLAQSIWWKFNTGIERLKKDIKSGVKVIDRATIESHRRWSILKLSNGFKIESHEIQQEFWEIGDTLEYEYTPLDRYILGTRIYKTNQEINHKD